MNAIWTIVDRNSVIVVEIFFSAQIENIKPEIIAGKTKKRASEMLITMHIDNVATTYNIKYLFLHKSVTIADENDNKNTKIKRKNGTNVDIKTNITFIATIRPNNAIFSTSFSFLENNFINKF